MNDINCPYCDAECEVCHDDGAGYDEGVRHEMTCHACDKNFVFTTTIHFYYESEKADCLNDSPHELELTSTYPREFARMACKHCEYSRKSTEQERAGVSP